MANPALAHSSRPRPDRRGPRLPRDPADPREAAAVRSPHHHDPGPPPCRGECGRLGHGVHDASADPEAIRALLRRRPLGYRLRHRLRTRPVPPHRPRPRPQERKPGKPPGNRGTGATDGRAGTRKPGASGKDGTGGMDSTDGLAADGLAALARLARDHAFAIPPTVTVLTPSGGRHLWLCGPSGLAVPNSAGRLAPGIDIRGLGGGTRSAPAHTARTAAIASRRAPPPGPRRPLRPPYCACSRPRARHRTARTAPARRPPGRVPRPWRGSVRSSAPHGRASATSACSGPPAAPTRAAPGRSWPPR
ncbi:hypothetical protein SANTM175S_00316 [Streptomyces antimycoticus]